MALPRTVDLPADLLADLPEDNLLGVHHKCNNPVVVLRPPVKDTRHQVEEVTAVLHLHKDTDLLVLVARLECLDLV